MIPLTTKEQQALRAEMKEASALVDRVLLDHKNKKLHGIDVAAYLKRAIAGELVVTLADANITWESANVGSVHFWVGDWRLSFFNDGGRLRHCESALTPDGQSGVLEEWLDSWKEPVSFKSGFGTSNHEGYSFLVDIHLVRNSSCWGNFLPFLSRMYCSVITTVCAQVGHAPA